jgi:hypothetical protein
LNQKVFFWCQEKQVEVARERRNRLLAGQESPEAQWSLTKGLMRAEDGETFAKTVLRNSVFATASDILETSTAMEEADKLSHSLADKS